MAEGQTGPLLEGGQKYDSFWLYDHRDALVTRADCEAAGDDVLLEALGCGNVESWGWLSFTICDLSWFLLLAHNWGLPSLHGPYGGSNGPVAKEAELYAFAARQFCELMRARGHDPMALMRRWSELFKEEGRGTEEEFVEYLREGFRMEYYVYTCESVPVSTRAGECLYGAESRAEFLAEIRRAQLTARRAERASPCVTFYNSGLLVEIIDPRAGSGGQCPGPGLFVLPVTS